MPVRARARARRARPGVRRRASLGPRGVPCYRSPVFEGSRRSSTLLRIRRILSSFWVRLALSVCIIISLLPFEWVFAFDGLFLVLFGVEFGARAVLIFRGYWDEDDQSWDEFTDERWRWPPPGRLVALTLDFLALLSFLPLPTGDRNTRWLRIFRLSRMLLLVRYWAPLVRDLWSVMSRRERARQVILMGAMVAGLSFAGTVVLENVAGTGATIDFNGDDVVDANDHGFLVQLWWAFRQIQDPGNMVASPTSTIALGVSLVLTVSGLLLVSFLIGLGTDVVRELVEISRLRAPGLSGHTVVVNVTPSTRALLHELMGYYRKLFPGGRLSFGWFRKLFSNARARVQGPRYVVVGNPVEAPDFLRHDELARLVYRQGSRDPGEFARRADVNHAQRVVLLADLESEDPDADTIHGLLTLVESMRLDEEEARPDARVRLLIAEILDESNVAAARAAIGVAGGRTRTFIVPTERLIALFVACVARRPGVGNVLEELLTSRGHEIYTCFFNLSGLGYFHDAPPALPPSTGECMSLLRERAIAAGSSRDVVPIGLLVEDENEPGEFELRLNPGPELVDECPRVRGFVSVAPHFAAVQDFAESLYRSTPSKEGAKAVTQLEVAPHFSDDPPPTLRRVLVGGFRSATVGMVESLMMGQPELEVLVLVDDEEECRAVFDDFDAHNRLQTSGLMRGVHASFPRYNDGLAFAFGQERPDRVRVRVAVGDQSSSRRLMDLPYGFGRLGDMDAVILIARENTNSDARTTKTLMKVEALLSANERAQRVVAEVLDADLARRLRRHYAQLGREDVRIYSIQELRSYFMFQSVVVPSFDLVYGELMGEWGQSLARLRTDGIDAPACSFAELEAYIARERSEMLIACEFDEGGRLPTLRVGAGGLDGDGRVDLRRLRAVWTVATAHADERAPNSAGAKSTSVDGSGARSPASTGDLAAQ